MDTFVVILAGERASEGEEIARVTARDVARAAAKAIALCVRAEFQHAGSIAVRAPTAASISFADGTRLHVFAPELAARHIDPVFVRWALDALPPAATLAIEEFHVASRQRRRLHSARPANCFP